MTLFQVSLIFLIFALICILKKKDFYHPSFLILITWGGLLTAYAVLEHPLYDLSEKFNQAILLWVLPFSSISYFISKGALSEKKQLFSLKVPTSSLFNRLYPWLIISMLVWLISLFLVMGFSNLVQVREMLVEAEFPLILKLQMYVQTFVFIFGFYIIKYWSSFPKKKVIFYIFLLFVVTLTRGAKTNFLILLVGVCYFLYVQKRLTVKTFIIVLLGFSLLIMLLTVLRENFDSSTDSAISNYLYIYFLSPLTAFDMLINGEAYLSPGSSWAATLDFFYKILNVFGFNFQLSTLGEYIQVPLPTNVYTALRGPYLDCGMIGIFIVSCLEGYFFGQLFKLQKTGNPKWQLFYAAIVSAIMFQSFGDYIFSFMSTLIQYYISAHIIIKYTRWKILENIK